MYIRRLTLVVLLLAAALCVPQAQPGAAASTGDWMEPQALNVVDLVGQVPDEVLAGHFISGTYGAGYARYVSSAVEGDLVHITVELSTRRYWSQSTRSWDTYCTLLGQPAVYDHMASTAPESWVRVYENGREITDRVVAVSYYEPPRTSPSTDASAWVRYPANERRLTRTEIPMEIHGLRIPANTGGSLKISGDHPWLTAVFTVQRPTVARVMYLGTQHETFQAFVGDCSEGDMGLFTGLVRDMRARYPGIRHPRIHLNIPVGANYVMFKYAPMPFDIYARSDYDANDPNSNLLRGMSGTVRLAPDDAMLSQNLCHGGPFPLRVAWQDADQSAGPYLSLLPPVDRVTPPEFFVLDGTEYHPCFQTGGCPGDLLDRIYYDTSPFSIVYLKVEVDRARVEARTLRAADDSWLPVTAVQSVAAQGAAPTTGPYRAHIPMVVRPAPPIELGAELPAGLFEQTSWRMVGYLY